MNSLTNKKDMAKPSYGTITIRYASGKEEKKRFSSKLKRKNVKVESSIFITVFQSEIDPIKEVSFENCTFCKYWNFQIGQNADHLPIALTFDRCTFAHFNTLIKATGTIKLIDPEYLQTNDTCYTLSVFTNQTFHLITTNSNLFDNRLEVVAPTILMQGNESTIAVPSMRLFGSTIQLSSLCLKVESDFQINACRSLSLDHTQIKTDYFSYQGTEWNAEQSEIYANRATFPNGSVRTKKEGEPVLITNLQMQQLSFLSTLKGLQKRAAICLDQEVRKQLTHQELSLQEQTHQLDHQISSAKRKIELLKQQKATIYQQFLQEIEDTRQQLEETNKIKKYGIKQPNQ